MPRLTSLQDWLGGGDTAMAGRLHLQDCPHATALAYHQVHGESSEDGSSRGMRPWRRDTVAAAEAAVLPVMMTAAAVATAAGAVVATAAVEVATRWQGGRTPVGQ